MGNKFHLAIIASGWIELSMNIRNWLKFEGGDGEKTLGQAEHSCIIWRKRYIINPNLAERAPSPPPQPAHDRCGLKLTKQFSIFNNPHSQLLALHA
jgi:hypothetical protein